MPHLVIHGRLPDGGRFPGCQRIFESVCPDRSKNHPDATKEAGYGCTESLLHLLSSWICRMLSTRAIRAQE